RLGDGDDATDAFDGREVVQGVLHQDGGAVGGQRCSGLPVEGKGEGAGRAEHRDPLHVGDACAARQDEVGRVAGGSGATTERSAGENDPHLRRGQGAVVNANLVHDAGRNFVGDDQIVDEEIDLVPRGREDSRAARVGEADLLNAVDVADKLVGG